jgi:signal-transduction protein with cAMP-binding, CBS, and nucleotidyltransferase domain
LYLIVKGAVEIKFFGSGEKVIAKLKKGQCFGE